MAVIESSGDGYVLYNGVKLFALHEWNKEIYPYAIIYYSTDDAGSILAYFGYSNQPYYFNTANSLVTNTDGSELFTSIYDAEGNVWGDVFPFVDAALALAPENVIWANMDVFDDAGELFLAASDPIVLDGMTVIEWDGDINGLESYTVSNFTLYKLSSNTISEQEAKSSIYTMRHQTNGYQYSYADNVIVGEDGTDTTITIYGNINGTTCSFVQSRNGDGLPGLFVFGSDGCNIYFAYTPDAEEDSTISSVCDEDSFLRGLACILSVKEKYDGILSIKEKYDSVSWLIDFEYIENDDGTYTLTAWKGTLNGKLSTMCVIPDSPLIILDLNGGG